MKLTAERHMHFHQLWNRLAWRLAERCTRALLFGDLEVAKRLAWRHHSARNREDGAYFCATSELADEFREGPPL